MSVPAWLRAAVVERPARFPVAIAAAALPEAVLASESSPAHAAGEVVALVPGEPPELRLGLPGLRGCASPLASAWCTALADLPADAPARGLVDAIEHRAHSRLVAIARSRPVDAPAAFAGMLAAMAGLSGALPVALAGQLADGGTAAALAAAAAHAARASVRVVPASGGELPLAEAARPGLGSGGALGSDHAIGRMVSGSELGFRLVVGPVRWDDAARLRPGGSDLAALIASVSALAPPACAWEAELLVDTSGAPRPGLGAGALGATARMAGEAPAVERELIHRHGCSPVAGSW